MFSSIFRKNLSLRVSVVCTPKKVEMIWYPQWGANHHSACSAQLASGWWPTKLKQMPKVLVWLWVKCDNKKNTATSPGNPWGIWNGLYYYWTRVRSLAMLVTHWLTDWLTDSCLVNLIDVTLACEDAYSKLVEVVTVADVCDEDRVGNSLLQIWKLRFGHKA